MRGTMHPQICQKDLLLATKWGFCRRDKGWGSKRSTFLGPRTPPPKSILATGLEKSFLFRQSGGGGHLDVMVYTWTSSLVKLITKHVLSFHAKKKPKQNKTKKKPKTPHL